MDREGRMTNTSRDIKTAVKMNIPVIKAILMPSCGVSFLPRLFLFGVADFFFLVVVAVFFRGDLFTRERIPFYAVFFNAIYRAACQDSGRGARVYIAAL
jgi:hypothetical protein